MSVYNIQVNHDITKDEVKSFGPFTGVQLVCVLVGGALVGIVGNLLKHFFPESLVSYLIAAPLMLGPIAIGWGDRFLHMPALEYFQLVIKRRFTHPGFRPYATHNWIRINMDKYQKEMEEEEKKDTAGKKKTKQTAPKKNIPEELAMYK